ncbi:hypothetical protein A0H81_12497 [Grifola frondosa]|uniref:Uncharacterized protein n=1 Tax=Grifola frondosa TaxID=5627 RepID=A0A1C7LSE4_GRIFR|nr:hypothetical protein A0H81_12497 [Grifola frondosa]
MACIHRRCRDVLRFGWLYCPSVTWRAVHSQVRLTADAIPDFYAQMRPDNADNILERACFDQWKECGEMLQSSVLDDEIPSLIPRSNGFVHTALEAYKSHHNLRIRPDDVWISMLNQFSFYINAHAEEMRDKFVAHEGRRKLVVSAIGNRYMVDFGGMAQQMTLLIHDNVVDKTLVDWILPNFTTTTVKDTTICSVLLMSTLKAYFEYGMVCMCGIPSVTLEGERDDWQKLLDRVDRFNEFGDEPKVWSAMLRPILRRFVSAFDDEPDITFWEHVAHRHEVFYGPDDMSGWITAFCVWSNQGIWQAGSLSSITANLGDEDAVKSPIRLTDIGRPSLLLNGVTYPPMSMSAIAEGYCEVDVDLEDNGERFDCKMVAGHLAMATSRSVTGGKKEDTVSPSPQWFMFVKGKRENTTPTWPSRSALAPAVKSKKRVHKWSCRCVIA